MHGGATGIDSFIKELYNPQTDRAIIELVDLMTDYYYYPLYGAIRVPQQLTTCMDEHSNKQGRKTGT